MIHLGPMHQTLGAEAAGILAAALGSQRPGWVPIIYPIRWLALPEIRTAIAAAIGPQTGLLLHETQNFEASTPLRAAATYRLSATVEVAGTDPPRLSLRGTASDDDGTVCARFTARLRLLPLSAPASPTPSAPPPTATANSHAWDVHAPVDADWVRRYCAASGDDNPLHLDPAIARQAGFTAPIVPGMQLLGLCERAVRAWYKDATILRLAGRFLHPLTTPARIAITGRRVQMSDDGRQITLRMFVGSEGQAAACVAEAALRLPPE